MVYFSSQQEILKTLRGLVGKTMAESADYDREGTAKDNLNENCDGHDAGWDISGAYESNNSGLTADVGINDALHSFQGRSDFLLEKYVHKVHPYLSSL